MADIADIKPFDLVDFKEFLLENGKAERTVNNILSCLRGYYDFLILHEVAKVNPVSNLLRIKVKSYRQERLTDEQLSIFYNYIDDLKENVRAAFYLMIGSGARVGEVTTLTKSDFAIHDGKMIINIKNAKWGSDRRIPVMSAVSADVVYKYLQTIDINSMPAFRMSKRTLQKHATNFASATGIPFHCHVLRHTFATLLLEQGIDLEKIQFLMGHKTPNVTRHYTQSAKIDVLSIAPSIYQGV